jgi:hypothetical protein
MFSILNGLMLIFLISKSLSFNSSTSSRPKEVTMKGNLICLADIKSKLLVIGLDNDLNADTFTSSTLQAQVINNSNKLKTSNVITPLIIPNNKLNALYVTSFLKIKGQVSYGTKERCETNEQIQEKKNGNNPPGEINNLMKNSFIQLSNDFENIFFSNVKQWKFSKIIDLTDINRSLNSLIKLHLADGDNNLSLTNEVELVKEIDLTSLSHFSDIKFETNFKFVDYLWHNNTVYIKINEELVFLEQHNWQGDDEICRKEIWTTPVSFNWKGTNSMKMKLTFGIKLNDHVLKSKICSDFLDTLTNNVNSIISFDNLSLSLK